MTAAEMLSLIDNHGFVDTDEADKLIALNDALWDLCSREPWPFLEKSIALTFDGSSATPTNFPTDFKSALSVVDTQFPRRLYPIRIEDFRSQLGAESSNTGDPTYYYFLARSFFVWPVPPSTNTTTVMTYLARQTALTADSVEADILLPKEHHVAIIDGALSRLYFEDDDPEYAADRMQSFEKRLQTMRGELWKVQYDRADTIEVVDEDDLYT
jgi:hypothetical protein